MNIWPSAIFEVMQNVQIPIWGAVVVTVGVALIGALGSIGAQFVNAWRESRRLEREDRYRQLSLWNDRRITLYTDMTDRIHTLLERMAGAILRRGTSGHPERHEEIANLWKEIERMRAGVMLVASPVIYIGYIKICKFLNHAQAQVRKYPEDPTREQIENALSMIMVGHENLRKLINSQREDVGVPGDLKLKSDATLARES